MRENKSWASVVSESRRRRRRPKIPDTGITRQTNSSRGEKRKSPADVDRDDRTAAIHCCAWLQKRFFSLSLFQQVLHCRLLTVETRREIINIYAVLYEEEEEGGEWRKNNNTTRPNSLSLSLSLWAVLFQSVVCHTLRYIGERERAARSARWHVSRLLPTTWVLQSLFNGFKGFFFSSFSLYSWSSSSVLK